RFGAGGSVASFFNYDQKPEENRTINYSPSQGMFGIPDAHVVTAGDPLRSVLYYRLSSLGPAHMPRIGSRVPDVAALNLIHDWIKQMEKPSATNAPAASTVKLEEDCRAALNELRDGKVSSLKGQSELIDRLLSSTVGALALLHEINLNSLNQVVQSESIR